MTEILEEIRARLARIEALMAGGQPRELRGPVDRDRRYTIREAADLLGMSKAALYTAMERGRLVPVPGPGTTRLVGAAVIAFAEGARARRGPPPGRPRTRA